MKHFIISMAAMSLILTILLPGMPVAQEKVVRLEVLFMNHGPMQPTIRDLKALDVKYRDGVQVQWFDFDRPEGKSFMKAKNLQGHIPLMIYVNGSPVYRIGDREVTFMGFPSGSGPYQFQGKWSVNDLETVIQSLLSSNS